MPPDTLTPGQRSLISPAASMNAFANAACSSMPVPTARMLGSKMMSSGAIARVLDQERVRSLADLHLPLDRLRLPLLVERHHQRGGAEAPDATGLVEERLLTLLQAERVGDALSLDTLQAPPRARRSASCRP